MIYVAINVQQPQAERSSCSCQVDVPSVQQNSLYSYQSPEVSDPIVVQSLSGTGGDGKQPTL